MSIIAREGNAGSGYTPMPEGTYLAVCTHLIDLGIQHSEKYGKSAHKVQLGWEIPGETVELEGDVVNRVIWGEYTTSLHEKSKLRQILQSWRGRAFSTDELGGFDMINILGKPCQVQIIHQKSADNTKTYASIAGIMAVPKGTRVEAQGSTIYFDMTEPNTFVLFSLLPEFIKNKIRQAENYEASGLKGFEDSFASDDAAEPDRLPF